jgi:hypothetical protein
MLWSLLQASTVGVWWIETSHSTRSEIQYKFHYRLSLKKFLNFNKLFFILSTIRPTRFRVDPLQFPVPAVPGQQFQQTAVPADSSSWDSLHPSCKNARLIFHDSEALRPTLAACATWSLTALAVKLASSADRTIHWLQESAIWIDCARNFAMPGFSHGRNAPHRAPPVQIRACGVTAHGSCLG